MKTDINLSFNINNLFITYFTKQISDILNMIQELEEADTKGIKPMAHPMNMSQRLRNDVPLSNNDRDLYQDNAMDSEDGFYKVPKVID